MRLNEFADPEEYTAPATDAENFEQQLFVRLVRPIGRRACTVRARQQKTTVDQAENTPRRAINR